MQDRSSLIYCDHLKGRDSLNNHTFIFDIGKTNIKGYVINDLGKIVWSKGTSNTPLQDNSYPHADLAKIETWLIATLKEANQEFQITKINISTHGACAVLIDGYGNVALPVLDYEHETISDDDSEYNNIRPPFTETLSPNLSAGLNLGRQLWWLKTHYPKEFANTKYVLMYPQYWAWRMTKIMANEKTSLGCHTDLWSPVADNYSALVNSLELAGAMPPLVKAFDSLGPVSAEFAAATGLTQDCLVFPGVHDSNASFARYLGNQIDAFTVVSTGTWIVTMCSEGQAKNLVETADMLANVSVLGQPIPCARFMGGREFDRLINTFATDSNSIDKTSVEREIALNNFIKPSFAEGSGPFQGQTGEIIGQPRSIAALATVYIALMIHHELNLLGANSGDIIFGSMGSKNPTLLSLLAQLRPQQRVVTSDETTGTVMGTWLLTRWSDAKLFPVEFKQIESLNILGLEEYAERWLAIAGV